MPLTPPSPPSLSPSPVHTPHLLPFLYLLHSFDLLRVLNLLADTCHPLLCDNELALVMSVPDTETYLDMAVVVNQISIHLGRGARDEIPICREIPVLPWGFF